MKKFISVILCFVMVFAMFSTSAFAGNGDNIVEHEGKTYNLTNNHPWVFVHGMGGWGPNDPFYETSPYWGGGLSINSGTDLIKILNEQGIEVALTTDHPVGPLQHLNISAAVCVREGLSMDAAIRAITINAAKASGVEDRVGSIAVGKDADIVVWTKHPFDFLSKAEAVFVGGKKVK